MTRPTRFAPPSPQGVGFTGGDPDLPPGQPVVDCCTDPEEMPDRVVGSPVEIGFTGGDGSLVQWEAAVDSGGGMSLAYPGDTTFGNLLVAVVVARGGAITPTFDDPAWLLVGDGQQTSGNRGTMFWRVAPGGPLTVTVLTPTNELRLYIAEFDGGAEGIFDQSDIDGGASTTTFTVPDVTVSQPVVLVGSVIAGNFPLGLDFTEDADFTNISEGQVGSSLDPRSIVGYRIVSPGTYDYAPTGSSASTYGGILAGFGLGSGWTGGGYYSIDEDDATYTEITGSNVIRVDLLDEFAIARIRLVIGCENSGAKSYTLKGATQPDFSDAVTVATIAFTATGSFTADTVTDSWAAETYRYWQLTGDDETRYVYSFELFEAGAEDASAVAAELDAHIVDPTDAHDASAVSADTTGFTHSAGDDVQEVLADLDAAIGTAGSGDVYTVETQAVQSKRYLMQDGTFRDPFIVGDGSLSVGSITTIANTGQYLAWPVIARMRDNRILLGYTDANDHHTDTSGKAVGRIGVEGFGGVVTWGSQFDIYDDPSEFVELTGLAVLSTGRIIGSFFQDTPGGGNPLDGAYVVWSDDDGATWETPVLVNSTLTSYSYGSGRVLELPNGDLLQCVEGKNSGDTFSRMVVLKSTDEGATWGSQVTIATGTRNYYEACLGLLDDDTILVLLRTSDGDGDIYQSSSTDGGATWATPTFAFLGHGQPNWVQLSTGTLVAITRENGGSLVGDVWAYTSTDRATTWSSPTTLDATMYEMEYGAPLEMLDGRVLVVYGYQVTSAITNSDIKQVYVTEGTDTFSSGAPTTVDYLVGTASGDLSAEIVVGTTPGGELGGTWGSPTVDTTHSGSSHAATQAAAEATAAAALAAHIASGGSSVTDHEHIVNVVFSGDASATVWELPAAPVSDSSIAVYIAGSRSIAWVLSGDMLTTLTFDSPPASATNNIVIDIVAATA